MFRHGSSLLPFNPRISNHEADAGTRDSANQSPESSFVSMALLNPKGVDHAERNRKLRDGSFGPKEKSVSC
jgi:hypothetical protein